MGEKTARNRGYWWLPLKQYLEDTHRASVLFYYEVGFENLFSKKYMINKLYLITITTWGIAFSYVLLNSLYTKR